MLFRSIDLPLSSLADRLDFTENDILRGLRYWEKKGLLEYSQDKNGNVTAIEMCDLLNEEPRQNFTSKTMTSSVTTTLSQTAPSMVKEVYVPTTATEIPDTYVADTYTYQKESVLLQNELAITSEGPGCEQWILNILEQYLERPLSPADIDTATFIYSELGFSSDLIFF